MNDCRPRISIIVAARPDQQRVTALTALRELDSRHPPYEVWLARGLQPSRQRNQAAQNAEGEILYFLDDDSLVSEENLAILNEAFQDDELAVLGGPNLCPGDGSFWQTVFAAVMSSRFAFGPSSARYRAAGSRRASSEKELILCNLAIRAKAYTEGGGLDEALYPNEENALMDQLSRAGRRMVYDPDLVVYRYPRRSIAGFVRMIARYGRGRGEQVRRYPSMGSLPNFVPSAFLGFVLLWLVSPLLPPTLQAMVWGVAFVYAILAVFCAMGLALRHRVSVALGALPLLPLVHAVYGAGLLIGVVRATPVRSPEERTADVDLERVFVSKGAEGS